MQKHESNHVHNRVSPWARSKAVHLCLHELGPLRKWCCMLQLCCMKMHMELYQLGLDVIEITVFFVLAASSLAQRHVPGFKRNVLND